MESEARTAMNKAMSEADLQRWVIQTAQTLGWRVHHSRTTKTQRRDGSVVYHTPISGDAGFFDLVLIHLEHGIIFAELKSQSGRLSERQRSWFDVAFGAKDSFDFTGLLRLKLWRPSDRDDIERILKGGA